MASIRWTMIGFLACAGAFASACGDDETTDVATATATLRDKNNVPYGKLTFTQPVGSDEVTIKMEIATTSSLAAAGEHGVHLHVTGSCVPPDFMSAMGHWNPLMAMHGDPASGAHHGGDLGNVMLGPDRTGSRTTTSKEMKISTGEPNSILGLGVIFHANRDDLITQMPPGNSGARLACGIVQLGNN